MVETIHERRNNLRVRLRTYSNLSTGDTSHTAHLINLSETGALVGVLEPHQIKAKDPVNLDIELPDETVLKMQGEVAHVKEHMIGLECHPASDADAAALQALIDQMSPQLQA